MTLLLPYITFEISFLHTSVCAQAEECYDQHAILFLLRVALLGAVFAVVVCLSVCYKPVLY